MRYMHDLNLGAIWKENKMNKIIILMTIWTVSITHATYMSRMSAMNRIRAPVAFRPGVMLQRPYPHRMIQTTKRRAPYIVYRNTPHRYAMKHLSPAPVRSVLGTWKTTRIPLGSSTPTVFVRAASPSPVIHADGAIHTIPAPNLSLLEKPIVVIDSSDSLQIQEPQRTTYEVTEKNSEQPYQSSPKIESPIGFSKASSPSAVDLQNGLRQNTALQVASEYTLPVHFAQPAVQLQQPSIVPQQFTLQGFHGIPNQQDLVQREPEQIIIPQNAFYPQDSLFMQKFQTQYVHQFPDAEFIPYTPELQPQYQNTANSQPFETQNQMILLQNEQITKQTPSAFTSSNEQKNVVQRETQDSSFDSIVPKAFTAQNITENLIETDVTVSTIDNVTEIQTPTTTIKNEIETTTEDQKISPIYYAQIGQSVGNVIAEGFYSAINDVRAAADDNKTKKEIKSGMKLEINQRPTASTTSTSTTTSTTTTTPSTTTTSTTTVAPTTQSATNAPIKNEGKKENQKSNLPKLNLGSPFEKATTTPSVNVAYTLLRAKDKQPRINEDGEVFAGQLVEAKISEDQEFNKEKATLLNRPVRFTATEKRNSESTSKRSVVKAKIPPKSKLTFDDKTGEPVLRIYASYIDSPGQKDIITTKLSNMKRNKDKDVTKKQDLNINWKDDDMNNYEKSLTDIDQKEQFGLKLRSRSDYYVPIFEDYE